MASATLRQPSFFPAFDGPSTPPRKEVRDVSRAQYRKLREGGLLTDRAHLVLTAIAHYYYVHQDWPTPEETCQWMVKTGKLQTANINVVAPRISQELVNGRLDRKTGQRVGGGVCELLPRRTCTVTGGDAHPVRIREAGSVLDRFGYQR